MVNPVTVNAGIIVPLTGADVDTWGEDDVNPNMVAIDGLFCGVQTVSVSNLPVTLTAPAGFVATPSPGPNQSQNRVLRFTGVLTADVQVTLPLPGSFLIDNRTTGSAFVLQFRAIGVGEALCIDQGSIVEIYNDGTNLRFVNLGKVGGLEFWGGIVALPRWVINCSVQPYVVADGAVYNFSDYPWLGAKYLGQFGGNGITTFGTQDLRGRVPLAYDGTGTRITVAGCGLNGQTMGAAIDTQGVAITALQLATHSHGITDPGHSHIEVGSPAGGASGSVFVPNNGTSGVSANSINSTASSFTGITINNTGSGQAHPNVQPSQVSGIWVIKT